MPDPFSDQMAEDHRRDYQTHRLFDDAQRTIRAILTSTEARTRLSQTDQDQLVVCQQMLEKRAAHIVAVWD